jgi:hypothetical protein
MALALDASLADVVRGSGKTLLCFVIPDTVARAPRLLRREPWRPLPACIAIAGALPGIALVLLVVHWVTGARCWNLTDWYVLYYFTLNGALLIIPRDAWNRLTEIAPEVDTLIKRGEDRVRLAARVQSMTRLDVQIALAALGFAAGVVGAIATVNIRRLDLAVSMPFLLSIGCTIGLGAAVVSCIASGMHWLYVFCRLPSVRYDSLDPANSSGLRNIYSLLARSQWYCTVGLVLALAPLAFLYNAARGSTFLRLSLLIAIAGSLLLVVLAYTVPPWLIHRTRVRDKAELLAELRQALPASLVGLSECELQAIERRLSVYEHVQGRATGRADRVIVTSLLLSLATIAAAVVPWVLARALSH